MMNLNRKVLIPSSSGLRFELGGADLVRHRTKVLIPSSSGLRFEFEEIASKVREELVLIPSSSGLRFEYMTHEEIASKVRS